MVYVNEFDRIGGGKIRWVQISVDGKIKKVRSRGGLFHGDIRVVVDGPHAGKILIPFWENILVHTAMKEGHYDVAYHDQKNLVYQIFGDVYSALRYTYHLLEEKYGISFHLGEKGRITSALRLLEDYNDVVVNLHKDNVNSLGAELPRRVGQILEDIGLNPRNEYKREARDLVVTLGSVFDSSGKVNQSVKMAKDIAARNRLLNRRVGILSIEPHIISRRLVLTSVIDEMELYWLGVYDFLGRLFVEKGKYEPRKIFSLLSKRDIRSIIVNRLSYYSVQLDKYDIIPFANTSRYVGEELTQAKWLIENGRYKEAAEILSRSWNSLKLRQIRTQLEEALTILTCSLFGKEPVVDKKAFDAIIFTCRKQINALKKVDESGFKHPVAKQCMTFVQATIQELIKKNIPCASKANVYLKKAVVML